MSVRAKFRCETILFNATGAEVTLQPVTSGSPENEEFYKYTPGGSIKLSTVNLAAAQQFEPGNDYYVDFIPANQ